MLPVRCACPLAEDRIRHFCPRERVLLERLSRKECTPKQADVSMPGGTMNRLRSFEATGEQRRDG